MIHYHGTPCTPQTASAEMLKAGHAFISFAEPRDLGLALQVCQSFAVDNGAFSAWKSGKPVNDWRNYYLWVGELHRYPSFDFAVIPDVIDGSEADNDALLNEWQFPVWTGAPVWHLHESIDRLERLANKYPRICFGSSGRYAQIGTPDWWQRMAESWNAITDRQGLPICKVHGLRMLNPDVFTRFPFSSVDSTNIARNIGLDTAWRGTYQPPTKEARARVMRERIESNQAPTFWIDQATQTDLFAA